MEKYDVIFGMGPACSCTQSLREAGLQLASFPFDWVGGREWLFKAQFMVDGFPGWFESGTLEFTATPPHSFHLNCKDKWGFTPIHDFNRTESLEDALPKVRAKYRRRINRLSDLLDKSSAALVMYVETPAFSRAETSQVPEMRRILAGRWPRVRFDFLVFKFREGLAFDRRTDESGDGWRVISYDYKDRKEEEWRADWRQIGAFLRSEYEVRDYRTAEERDNWNKALKTRDWGRYKAKSWPEYYLVKIQYKLYKHLQKILDRRGIV